MNALQKARARLAELAQKGKDLEAKWKRGEELTADDLALLDSLAPEIQAINEEIATLERRERDLETVRLAYDDTRRPAATPVAALNPRGGPEGEPGVGSAPRPGSIRAWTQSERFRAYAQHPGGTLGPYALGPEYNRYHGRDLIEHHAGMEPEELRTLVYQAATANLLQPQRLAGIFRGEMVDLQIRDLCVNARTSSNAVDFVRELVFTSAAAGVAEASDLAGTGALPQAALTFEVANAAVKNIGHHIPLTTQLVNDTPAMETYIEGRMQEGLREEEDRQLLNGASGNDLTGLLVTSGIGDLDNTYFTQFPVQGAGKDAERINRVRRARTYIKVTGRARANGIVAHPADVERWETLIDDDGNYLLRNLGPDGEGIRTLWRMPVVESESIAEGTALVGDWRLAVVFDRMEMTTAITDSHKDWWEHNILAMKVQERLAFAVIRPAGFTKVTLDPNA